MKALRADAGDIGNLKVTRQPCGQMCHWPVLDESSPPGPTR